MAKDTDFIGFSFNGRHSSEFNIFSVSNGSRYQDSLIPSSSDYTEKIPGGVGQYYFGTDTDIKEFPLEIAYDSVTEKQIREIRNWLSPNTIGELIFDERPYKTYIAKISDQPSLSFICFEEDTESKDTKRIYKGEGSINFVCYYPYAKTSEEKKELKYYESQINEKNSRSFGGIFPIVSYEVEGEATKIENIIGKTTISGSGDKSPTNPYKLTGAQPTQATICGKNLLPTFNSGFSDGISYSTNENGTITLNGIANSQRYLNSGHFFLVPGIYTLSSVINLPSGISVCLRTVKSTNVISRLSGNIKRNSVEITKSEEYFVFIAINQGTNIQNLTLELQVELGNFQSNWEKYDAKTYLLNDIPALYSSIYSNDKLDIITKEYTQSCFKYTLDGTESWTKGTYGTGEIFFSCALPIQAGDGAQNLPTSDGFINFTCSHFKETLERNTNRTYIYNSGNRICFYYDKFTEVSEWASWLSQQNTAGTPVEIVYARANPEITIRGFDSNIVYNLNKNYYIYYTNSDALISLRIFDLLYPTINQWSDSSGLLYDLNIEGENSGYDHYIKNIDGSGNINLYNPGDIETDFIISFDKPDNFLETMFIIDGERYFVLSLRNDESDGADLYGSASPEEVIMAKIKGGTITVDTRKRRIIYKSPNGEVSPIYYALKKGDFFKIPVNRLDGGYTLNINRELKGVHIQYDYLYY